VFQAALLAEADLIKISTSNVNNVHQNAQPAYPPHHAALVLKDIASTDTIALCQLPNFKRLPSLSGTFAEETTSPLLLLA
jgi:hypothetical protein